MSLTAKDVDEIMRLLDDSVFDELALEIGDLKLRLRRGGSAPGGIEEAPTIVADAPAPEAAAEVSPPPAPSNAAAAEDGLRDVASPLLGIFYRAPKPGAPPFVEVGQRVEEGSVIAIIEVMKLMNSVRSDVGGEVVEILPGNGALVEYGETLIRVRPG